MSNSHFGLWQSLACGSTGVPGSWPESASASPGRLAVGGEARDGSNSAAESAASALPPGAGEADRDRPGGMTGAAAAERLGGAPEKTGTTPAQPAAVVAVSAGPGGAPMSRAFSPKETAAGAAVATGPGGGPETSAALRDQPATGAAVATETGGALETAVASPAQFVTGAADQTEPGGAPEPPAALPAQMEPGALAHDAPGAAPETAPVQPPAGAAVEKAGGVQELPAKPESAAAPRAPTKRQRSPIRFDPNHPKGGLGGT